MNRNTLLDVTDLAGARTGGWFQVPNDGREKLPVVFKLATGTALVKVQGRVAADDDPVDLGAWTVSGGKLVDRYPQMRAIRADAGTAATYRVTIDTALSVIKGERAAAMSPSVLPASVITSSFGSALSLDVNEPVTATYTVSDANGVVCPGITVAFEVSDATRGVINKASGVTNAFGRVLLQITRTAHDAADDLPLEVIASISPTIQYPTVLEDSGSTGGGTGGGGFVPDHISLDISTAISVAEDAADLVRVATLRDAANVAGAGTISCVSSAAGVMSVTAPTSGASPKSFTLNPQGPGTCTLTFSSTGVPNAVVNVTVTAVTGGGGGSDPFGALLASIGSVKFAYGGSDAAKVTQASGHVTTLAERIGTGGYPALSAGGDTGITYDSVNKCLVFDGTSAMSATSTLFDVFAGTLPGTFVMVAKFDPATGSGYYGGAFNGANSLLAVAAGGGFTDIGGAAPGGTGDSGVAQSATIARILVITLNADLSAVVEVLDHTSVTTAAGTVYTGAGGRTFCLGNIAAGFGSGNNPLHLYETFFTTKVLTSGDRTALKSWAAANVAGFATAP